MNRICTRSVFHTRPSLTLPSRMQPLLRRTFHPEPRSFQASPHNTHRFVYRWVIQAIGTPFAVAYLCEKVVERSQGGSESSSKMEWPEIDLGVLRELRRMKSQSQGWGLM